MGFSNIPVVGLSLLALLCSLATCWAGTADSLPITIENSFKNNVTILPDCCPYLRLPNRGESIDEVERCDVLDVFVPCRVIEVYAACASHSSPRTSSCRCEYNRPAETDAAPPEPGVSVFNGTLGSVGPEGCPVACAPSFYSVRFPR